MEGRMYTWVFGLNYPYVDYFCQKKELCACLAIQRYTFYIMCMCVHMCKQVCVSYMHVCVFQQTSRLIISMSWILEFWGSGVMASYNSSQTKIHQKCFIDRCMISWPVKQAERHLYLMFRVWSQSAVRLLSYSLPKYKSMLGAMPLVEYCMAERARCFEFLKNSQPLNEFYRT